MSVKQNRFFILASGLLFVVICGFHNQTDVPVLKGPYLGQKVPGLTPELFAPGIITTKKSEGCSGWGNRMEFFIFQRWIDGKSNTYIMENTAETWKEPELVPFSDSYQLGDFTIAPDGKTIVFASRLLIEEIGSEGEGANIWTVEKTENGWTEPEQIGRPVNTKYHDSYPCLAANRNLYFFGRKPGGFGKSDIYMAVWSDGRYEEPVNFGERFNTEHHEWDTYIAPDESYMIYCSTMPGGLGEDDLYITFRQQDGSWCDPTHMGAEINSAGSENRPYVSPDGKYFFFTSDIRGNRDIFWVDARIFDEIEVRHAVESLYIEGLKIRDFNLIREICIPETRLNSVRSDGTLSATSLDRWSKRFDPDRPPFQKLEYEILKIDVEGTAAQVKIKFTVDDERVVHDYLNLLKIEDRWRIVNIIDN